MRLYVLELKRLLKTRSVGILIIAALILSAVLSYLPVTYIQAYKTTSREQSRWSPESKR